MSDIEKLKQLLKAQDRVIYCIDGCSAAGKTSYAKELALSFDATVIHMDDFFLPPQLRTPSRYAQIGGNIHYERFMDEVIIPLQNHQRLSYQIFDCHALKCTRLQPFDPKRLIIVEGAYCLHPFFGHYYDLSTVMLIDEKEQKRRILERNGEQGCKQFEQRWIPLENAYLKQLLDQHRTGFTDELTATF